LHFKLEAKSQIPVDHWHEVIADPALADAIWIILFTTVDGYQNPHIIGEHHLISMRVFKAPHLPHRQIPLAYILPEAPSDTSIPLRYGSCEYIRSFTHIHSKLWGIEPQGIQ